MSKYKKHAPKTPITNKERAFLKRSIEKLGYSVSDYAKQYGFTHAVVYGILNQTQPTHTKTSRKLFDVIGYESSENKADGHAQGASDEGSGPAA